MPTGPPADVHVTYSRQYRRCHKPSCTICQADGPGHGPYWFAYWREDGRVRSRYLGKSIPAGAALSTVVLEPPPGVFSQNQPAFIVRTLGEFVVIRGGKRIAASSWRRRPVAALFTCLLSAPGHRLHREQVIDALWPDAEFSLATRELHRATHALRKMLNWPGQSGAMLRFEGDVLVLEPADSNPDGGDWLDADVFARYARAALHGQDRAACREALARYGGAYLPDDPYSEWVVPRREELQARHLEVALYLARLSGSAGDLEEAEQCLRLVLRHDACQEGAAATLMGILASSGRRVDALRVYQALAAALDSDLGVQPSSEIEELRGRLLALEGTAGGPRPPSRVEAVPVSGNLPAAMNSFVGREWEQGEIAALLSETRLITLTGPGGCGKTRLALETAGKLGGRFQDGIWLVELAALRDGALVAEAIVAALGTLEEPREAAGTSLVSALCGFLRSRRVLLVLDNCEHLIAACAEIVMALLRGCPDLRILATSREALAIAGETIWYVPPLAAPPLGNPVLTTLARYEAVRLFVDRARAARPDFALTEANASAIVQICHRLDGLPLAIELAAARLGVFSVQVVAARLDNCFTLLTGGSRTALPRQQTLKATIDWSYGLLAGDEQTLLRRLSLFAGGWTLEAATAVCGDLPLDERDVNDRISVLHDELSARSLIRAVEHEGARRFGMLETMRQYAREQLLTAGETADIQDRHRTWFLREVRRAGAALRTPDQAMWLDRLEADIDNLRESLAAGALRTGDHAAILAHAEPLTHFCLVRGHIADGRRWIGTALAGDLAGASAVRAAALNAAGTLASEQGEYDQAMVLYEEGLAIFHELGDTRGAVRVLINQGNVTKYQGDLERARILYETGCRRAREHGDPSLLATALNNLGTLAIELGDNTWAKDLLEESLALKRQSGSQAGVIQVLVNLGEVARAQADPNRAAERYEDAQSLAQALGDRPHIALVRYNLGLIAAEHGDHARAAAELRASLGMELELGNARQIAAAIEGLAAVAANLSQPGRAGLLLGAAEKMRERIGAPVPAVDGPRHARETASVRATLGTSAAALTWQQGRALAMDAAVAEALLVGADGGNGRM
ncbi:MAG TPA: tetratricopeptide repeat protein [Chloroflexota bacterium]|jgi:predicted ATPase/DNA-binding SARP family transcriptional activator